MVVFPVSIRNQPIAVTQIRDNLTAYANHRLIRKEATGTDLEYQVPQGSTWYIDGILAIGDADSTAGRRFMTVGMVRDGEAYFAARSQGFWQGQSLWMLAIPSGPVIDQEYENQDSVWISYRPLLPIPMLGNDKLVIQVTGPGTDTIYGYLNVMEVTQ